MIDKFIYKCCDFLDRYTDWMNKIFESKPKKKKMSRKSNTALIALLGTILMGLSTWVIVTLVELQVLIMMFQQELMDLDKVIGRIYHHMDRLSQK